MHETLSPGKSRSWAELQSLGRREAAESLVKR
jgi:hypothetical protein